MLFFKLQIYGVIDMLEIDKPSKKSCVFHSSTHSYLNTWQNICPSVDSKSIRSPRHI